MTDNEINEVVARKLGWKYRNYDPNAIEIIERIPCYTAPNGDIYSKLPDYCHSIAAAWEILNQWHGEWSLHGSNGAFLCELYRPSEEYDAHADTAPRAICLAFLKLEDK